MKINSPPSQTPATMRHIARASLLGSLVLADAIIILIILIIVNIIISMMILIIITPES